MNLVMLPGMDGTGILFDRLIDELSCACRVIALPQGEDQSYAFLLDYVVRQLPCEEFILLAESFSGPIAADIASRGHPHLKAVIFLATFLYPPKPVLLYLARLAPLHTLIRLPFAKAYLRRYCVGYNYPLAVFLSVLKDVSPALFRARLKALSELDGDKLRGNNLLPVLLLSARDDVWITQMHIEAFKTRFARCEVHSVPGTHFLAQSNPHACAETINQFLLRFVVLNKPDPKGA